MTLSFAANQCYDIALNGNAAGQTSTNSLTVIADTIAPNTSHLEGTYDNAYIKDNGNGTYTVRFTEPLYYLDGSTLKALITSRAPKLELKLRTGYDTLTGAPVYEDENSVINASRINNGANYEITYYAPTGAQIVGLSDYDNIYDIAVNPYSNNSQVAAVLRNISVKIVDAISEEEIVPDANKKYGRGTILKIKAEFSKEIEGNVPALSIIFGDGETRQISEGEIIGNSIVYTYIIGNENKQDNGKLAIVDYKGGSLAAKDGTPCVLPEATPVLAETVIADTKAPTVVEITSNTNRTNESTVEYTITWSEPVYEFTKWGIDVINGSIGELLANEDNTVFTLTVDTTGEGRQIVKIPERVCRDEAGNWNTERKVYSDVVIDYTRPSVRAKVNGGKYVIDMNNNNSLLKEILVVNEEISSLKYVWSKSETLPTDENLWTTVPNTNIESNNDIPLNTTVSEAGTYYLYMKVTDLAGNTFTGRTNGFVVSNDQITIQPSTTSLTNNDVVAHVIYGTETTGLTENRRAGIQGKTQSADPTTVILTENGVVYAEATDKNGNKVYATLQINNIDRTVPEISVRVDDKTITITSNDPNSKYIVRNISDKPQASDTGWSTNNVVTVENPGKYYVWVIDEAGNISGTVVEINSTTPTPQPDPTPTPGDTTPPTITASVYGDIITVVSEDSDIDKYIVTTTTTTPDINATGWQKSAVFSGKSDGTYYAWAKDTSGNISAYKEVVVDTTRPEIVVDVAENSGTIKKYTENNTNYIIVSPTVTVSELTSRLSVSGSGADRSKLSIDNLNKDGKLRTYSYVNYDKNTKFVIAVLGDVNGDGEVTFNDVFGANSIRGAENKQLIPVRLAADINHDGTVSFEEVLAINAIRTK